MRLSAVPPSRVAGRLLRAPLRLIPPNAAMPILRGRLRGKRWIAGSATHGCWLGTYEMDQRHAFEREVRPGAVVFDVGAHAGYYTLLASVLIGSAGTVVAFEPLARNLAFLRRHLELNRVRNARVLEAAVSDIEGEARFEESTPSEMSRLAEGGKITVRTVTLDGSIRRGEAPIPDVVKVDVEGAEVAVLRGAHELLAAHRPTVFLSTHGPERRRAAHELLAGHGYRLHPLGRGPLDSSDEILATAG